jgi:hypothetical protein
VVLIAVDAADVAAAAGLDDSDAAVSHAVLALRDGPAKRLGLRLGDGDVSVLGAGHHASIYVRNPAEIQGISKTDAEIVTRRDETERSP